MSGGAEAQQEDEWSIVRRPRPYKKILAICAVGLVAATVGYETLPSYLGQFLGPAPVWHAFPGTFDSSGILQDESCSLKNLQYVLNGIDLGKVTAQTIVSCSYHGETYTGLVGTDCNMNPSGVIPSINGTLIPFDGCVLSFAPLNYAFAGIFTLSAKVTNKSIPVYYGHRLNANLTPTTEWKTYRCSLKSDSATNTTSSIVCFYLGIPYESLYLQSDCNLGTPIQVNGVPVPVDSCDLSRNEIVVG